MLAALVAVDLAGSAGPSSHGLRESAVVVGVAAVPAAVAWRTRNVAVVSLLALALAAAVAVDLGPW